MVPQKSLDHWAILVQLVRYLFGAWGWGCSHFLVNFCNLTEFRWSSVKWEKGGWGWSGNITTWSKRSWFCWVTVLPPWNNFPAQSVWSPASHFSCPLVAVLRAWRVFRTAQKPMNYEKWFSNNVGIQFLNHCSCRRKNNIFVQFAFVCVYACAFALMYAGCVRVWQDGEIHGRNSLLGLKPTTQTVP